MRRALKTVCGAIMIGISAVSVSWLGAPCSLSMPRPRGPLPSEKGRAGAALVLVEAWDGMAVARLTFSLFALDLPAVCLLPPAASRLVLNLAMVRLTHNI